MTAILARPPVGPVSEEEFSQFLAGYEGLDRWELIDGEIRAISEPSMLHELLISGLTFQLQFYLYQNNLSWIVRSQMLCRMGASQYRRPDLLVAAPETLAQSQQRQANTYCSTQGGN